jgi:hypothetical protein
VSGEWRIVVTQVRNNWNGRRPYDTGHFTESSSRNLEHSVATEPLCLGSDLAKNGAGQLLDGDPESVLEPRNKGIVDITQEAESHVPMLGPDQPESLGTSQL